MDPISNLFWNVFQNVLGNRVDAYFFGGKKVPEPSAPVRDQQRPESYADEETGGPTSQRRFDIFDARYDIEGFYPDPIRPHNDMGVGLWDER